MTKLTITLDKLEAEAVLYVINKAYQHRVPLIRGRIHEDLLDSISDKITDTFYPNVIEDMTGEDV